MNLDEALAIYALFSNPLLKASSVADKQAMAEAQAIIASAASAAIDRIAAAMKVQG